MNLWLFSFAVSLAFLIILTDYKQLKINIWGGIIPAIFQTAQNVLNEKLELWRYEGVGRNLPDWPVFTDGLNVFLIGIAFSIGVIFFQHIPENLYLQAVHVVMFTLLWGIFKILARRYGMQTNLNWNNLLIAHGFILIGTSLSWLKTEYFKGYCKNETNTVPDIHK